MRKFVTNWLPVLVWCAVIFYLSTVPQISPPININYIDLVGHALFYALFSFLVARGFNLKFRPNKFALSVVVVALVSVYGALMEWYQSYLPTRTAESADEIANFAGACFGIVVYGLYNRLRVKG